MKNAQLFHNPGAGGEEHNKDEIISLLDAEGFDCRYSSTKKKGWKEIDDEADFLVVAGGDGTVRKVTEVMLDRPQIENILPIGLLPLGTANNIAKTLGLSSELPAIVKSWHNRRMKPYDVGKITNKELEARFFLESLGFGIFPYLMMEMKKRKEVEEEEPEEKLRFTLNLLRKIVKSYEPRYCHLEINGKDYSGTYLLAEVMNTRSIGPNLHLAPDADPGDGFFEVVLVPESEKDKFYKYVDELAEGSKPIYDFHPLPARQITISWDGTHLHIDDFTEKIEKCAEIRIEVKEALLQFLVM